MPEGTMQAISFKSEQTGVSGTEQMTHALPE